jgi:transcriptional regulator with XRE-family HTH domain
MLNNRPQCETCGGFLRRGHTARWCDPCTHKLGVEVRKKLPVSFYASPEFRMDLLEYRFQRVFAAVLSMLDLSQEALGALVGMTQQQISAIVKGTRAQVTRADSVAKIATGLGIPAGLLGFGQQPSDPYEEADWMDRRTFEQALATILMGIGAGLDLDRLRALLPTSGEERVPRRIGAENVTAIEEATAGFRTSHYQYGGGMSRAAAVAQLDYALRLRESQCSEQVRADLQIATAALANTASWMSVEAGLHADARRLAMIGLDTARHAEHPHSTDLMIEILMNIAQQARYLGQPREAIDLVRYADNTMAMSKYPVSAPTLQRVHTSLAVSQAALGQREPCLRALAQAAQTTADIGADHAGLPPWTSSSVPIATYSAQHGHSLFLLSRTEPDCAPTAIEYLRTAIDGYGPGRASVRARSLPALAGSYALAGDLDAAVTIGHEAVTVIDGLSSTIPHPWLRTLAQVTEPHNHRSDVAELRHRVDEVLTTTVSP